MFCTQCGSQAQDIDQFCATCGTALVANREGRSPAAVISSADSKPQPSMQQRISVAKDAAAPLAKTIGIATLKWGARLLFFAGGMIIYLAWKEYTLKHGTENAAVAVIRAVVVFGSFMEFWKWTKKLDEPGIRKSLFSEKTLSKLGTVAIISIILAALLYTSDVHMMFKVSLTLIGLPVILIQTLLESSTRPSVGVERRSSDRMLWRSFLGILALFALLVVIGIAAS